MKKVIIGTPALYGQVSAYYTHALAESTKICLLNGIDLTALFLSNESILPLARNELLNIAYKSSCDEFIFIDSDISWNPKYILEIINSKHDVVGMSYPRKTDISSEYDLVVVENPSLGDYIEVYNIGTGFLKLSKRVIRDLWETSDEITFRDKKLKEICKYGKKDNIFIGEDYNLCNTIKSLDYKIYVYTKHTCNHVGSKVYTGDFYTDLIKVIHS